MALNYWLTPAGKEELSFRRKSREIGQGCYALGCQGKAIRSHIQQRKGPLFDIAVNGSIVCLATNYARKSPTDALRFEKTGIKGTDILEFWVFCADCDRKLFKEIESENVDYTNYRVQLLFSYRGFVNELYKQEFNIKFIDLVIKSSLIPRERKEIYQSIRDSQKRLIEIGRRRKVSLEREIKNTHGIFRWFYRRQYKFHYFRVPRVEICTSATASPLTNIFPDDFNNPTKMTCAFFLNLMPKSSDLHIIVGQSSVHLPTIEIINIKEFEKLDSTTKLKRLSDLMVLYLETWCVSVKHFNKWQSVGMEKKILSEITKYLETNKKLNAIQSQASISVNLFE